MTKTIYNLLQYVSFAVENNNVRKLIFCNIIAALFISWSLYFFYLYHPGSDHITQSQNWQRIHNPITELEYITSSHHRTGRDNIIQSQNRKRSHHLITEVGEITSSNHRTGRDNIIQSHNWKRIYHPIT